MRPEQLTPSAQLQHVMVYVAELELEVDRLRRRDQFVQQEAWEHNRSTIRLCRGATTSEQAPAALAAVAELAEKFGELLRDVIEPPGYHPAFDQVVAIAVRPLIAQIFRLQQRITGAKNAVLHLELEPDHLDWFPARLRNILENLLSNALRYRDSMKGEIRVSVSTRLLKDHYELQVTDNGQGIPFDQAAVMLEMYHRAAPSRAGGLGVGLAVVKYLVEQCCGSVTIDSDPGRGTSVTIVLPRYDLRDFVE